MKSFLSAIFPDQGANLIAAKAGRSLRKKNAERAS
jgi:hypothetical protein